MQGKRPASRIISTAIPTFPATPPLSSNWLPGNLAKALPLYEAMLEKRKSKFGPDHPDTLVSMNNLASAYQAAGQVAKALPLLNETLQKATEKFGPEHPTT